MDKVYIICVDDQPEVLNTIASQLDELSPPLNIDLCESGKEAFALCEEIDAAGDYVALVISDHVMPHMSGVELLESINEDVRFAHTRKILLTGLATHEDTIQAINRAEIDNYIEKPWVKEDLVTIIKTLVTHFLLEKGIDHTKYSSCLDQETLYEILRKSS